jgi:hypothetical protein
MYSGTAVEPANAIEAAVLHCMHKLEPSEFHRTQVVN